MLHYTAFLPLFWRCVGHCWSGPCTTASLPERFCKAAAAGARCVMCVSIHLEQNAGDTFLLQQRRHGDSKFPRFSRVSLAVAHAIRCWADAGIVTCCFVQSFTGAVAFPHPPAAPFIRTGGCGSRPSPPVLINSTETQLMTLLWEKSLALELWPAYSYYWPQKDDRK